MSGVSQIEPTETNPRAIRPRVRRQAGRRFVLAIRKLNDILSRSLGEGPCSHLWQPWRLGVWL
jgi:hypothetical protein